MPSQLVKDLYSVSNIVGTLGLSLAEAQKQWNLDYIQSVSRLVAMAKELGAAAGGADVNADVAAMAKHLLTVAAPSRYQFTETTISVKLDLSQSLRGEASVSVGAGFGAVAVNAALTVGYGYDYQAAAELKAVIHAIPADPTVLQPLLARGAQLNDKTLDLRATAGVDKEIHETNTTLIKKLTGVA